MNLEVFVFRNCIETRAALDEFVWFYDAIAVEVRGGIAVPDYFLDSRILALEFLDELDKARFLLGSTGVLYHTAVGISSVKSAYIADTD